MASLYVRNGIYWIKYRHNGRLVRKSLRTRNKDKAQDDLEEITARVRLNLLGLPSPVSSPTLQELFDEYLAFSKGRNDPRTYRDHDLYVRMFLGPAFGHIPADQLNDRHIEDFIALLKSRRNEKGRPDPYHPETINKRLKFLRQVLRRAARPGSGVIDKIPVSIAEHLQKAPRSLPKYITPQQFALWWPHVHKPVNKMRAVIEICTGIPDSELARMTWKDNYSEEMGVLKYKRKKTGIEIVVKLNKWALEAIAELRRIQRGPFIFKGVKYARRAYEVASANSGIKVTPHMLRHSFATWALSDGIGIERVKEALGHASSTTTQIYARVMPQFLAETTGAIDRMRPSMSLLPAPRKARRARTGHNRKKKD